MPASASIAGAISQPRSRLLYDSEIKVTITRARRKWVGGQIVYAGLDFALVSYMSYHNAGLWPT